MPTTVFTECIALYVKHLVYWLFKNDIIITCSQQIDTGSDVYRTNLPSSCVFRLRLKSYIGGGGEGSGETQHFTLFLMSQQRLDFDITRFTSRF